MAELSLTVDVPKAVKYSLPNNSRSALSKDTVISNQYPKIKRLLTPRDYRQVFSDPVKFFQPGLLILCCANDLGFARLGMAVSKKNLPKAVDRNRVKRIIRESFRNSLYDIGVDVVVLTRNPIINMDNTQILKQLDWMWQRVNKRDW